MSLNAIRVDLFDDFQEITLAAGQFEQFGFIHVGFDAGHWVICSVQPIPSSGGQTFTSVQITQQWMNMQADGSTDYQVVFHNFDSNHPATFRPIFLVAPSLGG